MAISGLSKAQIDSLVESYKVLETSRFVDPLTKKKTRYSGLSTQYGTLSSKVSALKSVTESLKNTNTDSVFNSKVVTMSANEFFTANAANTLQKGSFSLKIDQLAKTDTILSKTFTSTDSVAVSGDHQFNIKTGDGTGGEFTADVSVSLTGSETAQSLITKVKEAVANHKIEVTSPIKDVSDVYSGGDSSFKVTLAGKDYTVNITGATTYSQVMDQVTAQLSTATGLSVSKVVNNNNISLKFSVTDKKKDITIQNVSGFDLVSDLSIGMTKKKAASEMVAVSSFKPNTLTTRLSFTATKTGLDYRVTNISDIPGSSVLTTLGMNFGTTRTQLNQETNPDDAGFFYSDITPTGNLLNSKFVLNGLSLQRSSNQISDVVDGLTLNFKGTMKSDANPIDFTTGTDTKTVREKIDNFITKYNDLFSLTEKPTDEAKNDANFRSINQIITQKAYSLFSIGISFSPGTGLSVTNSEVLNKHITDYPEKTMEMFTTDPGIATQINTSIKSYLGAAGIINNNTTSFGKNIKYLTDKIELKQKNIDKGADALRKKYVDLSIQIMSLMNSNGIFE